MCETKVSVVGRKRNRGKQDPSFHFIQHVHSRSAEAVIKLALIKSSPLLPFLFPFISYNTGRGEGRGGWGETHCAQELSTNTKGEAGSNSGLFSFSLRKKGGEKKCCTAFLPLLKLSKSLEWKGEESPFSNPVNGTCLKKKSIASTVCTVPLHSAVRESNTFLKKFF